MNSRYCQTTGWDTTLLREHIESSGQICRTYNAVASRFTKLLNCWTHLIQLSLLNTQIKVKNSSQSAPISPSFARFFGSAIMLNWLWHIFFIPLANLSIAERCRWWCGCWCAIIGWAWPSGVHVMRVFALPTFNMLREGLGVCICGFVWFGGGCSDASSLGTCSVSSPSISIFE